MKVIALAVLFTVANATSLTYTTGPVKAPHASQIPSTGIGHPRVSSVRESVHEETGDAFGNRAGGFVSRDNDGNVRTLRYNTGPEQVYRRQQQRDAIYGVPASVPARYNYDSNDRSQSYQYGPGPRSHSVTFTAPLANTYSVQPQFHPYGSVRRYF